MTDAATLTVKVPGEAGTTYDLGKKIISIGRAGDNVVQIKDLTVSSHHALLYFKKGGYILTDLGSTNGTRVNGSYIKMQTLEDGDRLLFGKVLCSVELPGDFVVSKSKSVRLLRISRKGKLLGYFTPENARENLRRGMLKPDDAVCHDS